VAGKSVLKCKEMFELYSCAQLLGNDCGQEQQPQHKGRQTFL